MERITGSMLS